LVWDLGRSLHYDSMTEQGLGTVAYLLGLKHSTIRRLLFMNCK
jgi:hypothetical protein